MERFINAEEGGTESVWHVDEFTGKEHEALTNLSADEQRRDEAGRKRSDYLSIR